jgi:hypothetical protein
MVFGRPFAIVPMFMTKRVGVQPQRVVVLGRGWLRARPPAQVDLQDGGDHYGAPFISRIPHLLRSPAIPLHPSAYSD